MAMFITFFGLLMLITYLDVRWIFASYFNKSAPFQGPALGFANETKLYKYTPVDDSNFVGAKLGDADLKVFGSYPMSAPYDTDTDQFINIMGAGFSKHNDIKCVLNNVETDLIIMEDDMIVCPATLSDDEEEEAGRQLVDGE